MIILIADSCAAVYACGLLAEELSQQGLECVIVATENENNVSLPVPKNPPENSNAIRLDCSLNQLLNSPLITKAEAVGAFITTNKIEAFTREYRHICQLYGQQPAPVFSGPVFPLSGDLLIADLLPRLCCDLICLHGQRQIEEARDLMHLWPNPVPTVALGFWFMPESPDDGGLVGADTPKPPHTLVVLTQKGLPNLPGAQRRIMRLISEKASESPHWRVLVQPDHTLSAGKLPLETKPSELARLPSNISIGAKENLPLILGRCSACITLSSPWIYTAIAWGRPVMVIGDHGIRTDQGSVAFFGSGVMGRLDSLTNLDELLERPRVNGRWLEHMGWGVHDGSSHLRSVLQGLMTTLPPL